MHHLAIEQNPFKLKQFSQRWLILLSMLALVSIIFTYTVLQSDTYKNTPALDQVAELKTQLLESHLLYEEMRFPGMEDSQHLIQNKIERTHFLVEESIKGHVSVGEIHGAIPDDQVLHVKLEQLHQSLHQLIDQLKQGGLESGHDDLFAFALESAEAADMRMHKLIALNMSHQQVMFGLFMIVWLIVVLFLIWRWRAVSVGFLLASGKLHRLSHAAEQMGESLLISNRDGVIEYVNPAFTRITGYEHEEVFGKNPSLLSSGRQSKAFYEKMWGDILNGHIWRGEVVDKRKDGTLYRADMSISPIFGKAGEVSHFVAIQRDITELREMQENLSHAKKMDAIGTMCCGLAHDMNNTLSVLIGNLEMAMMDKKMNGETRDLVDQAETAALFAATMMKELLVFSRKEDVKLEFMDLNELVDETLMLMQTSYQHVRFEYNPPRESNFILGDQEKLHRILVNIIRNACDAMEETARPTIWINIENVKSYDIANRLEDKGLHAEWTRLSITDNGCGIPENLLEKVFDPFFTTKEIGKGTGLGLSSVYGLVKSHQGFVDITSMVNDGTTIFLYFPAKKLQG